jgi:hypothetical protein
VGQCNTFEGKKYSSIWSCRKKVILPQWFFFFLGKAGCENYTSPKIWQPCPKMGQGWPWKGRDRVESQAPLPPHFNTPLPWKGGSQREGRKERGGSWGEDLDSGRDLQWVHGLGPCTTLSLGCPPKLLLKLNDFSISFGDFSFSW